MLPVDATTSGVFSTGFFLHFVFRWWIARFMVCHIWVPLIAVTLQAPEPKRLRMDESGLVETEFIRFRKTIAGTFPWLGA